MAIKLQENPYQGVNAHLQSLFQRPTSLSMWPGFHSQYIINTAQLLNRLLPAPYQAVAEQSLQLLVSGGEPRQRKPDAVIYRDAPPVAQGPGTALLTPTWKAAVEDTFAEPDEILAVVIYHAVDTTPHDELGTPVARLEVFSPSNKGSGDSFWKYVDNRQQAIESGLVLVEIDFLHELRSPIFGLPRYPHDNDSYSYTITISDPRLPSADGNVFAYGFGVDELIPTLTIPLSGSDVVKADFGVVYTESFESGRWWKRVDYAQEPERMETYSEKDQAAIRAKMTALQAAQHSEEDSS